MLRISTTHIDSYRLYRDQDWMEKQKLIDDITGVGPPTEFMTRSSALHKVLEKPNKYATDTGYIVNVRGQKLEAQSREKGKPVYDWLPYEFDGPSLAPAFALIPKGSFHEVRCPLQITTKDGETVDLISKADAVYGTGVQEFKWPKQIDPEKYMDSIQWRIYLKVLDAAYCEYLIFNFTQDKKTGIFTMRECTPVKYYAYNGMNEYIDDLVNEFVHFIHSQKLESYFQPTAYTDALFV